MESGIIKITSKGGTTVEMPRTQLLSVIEGEPTELNFWSAKMNISFVGRSGNTNQEDFQASIKIKREATRSRLDITYLGNFGEVDSVQTINNHRGSLEYNVFLSRLMFVSPFALELFSDEFQNIDIRYTVGVGAGYYIFRQGNVDWNVGLGGAYQKTNWISVEEGEADFVETGTVVPSTLVDWDITSKIDWYLTANYQIGVPDPKNSQSHLNTEISIDFFSDIFEFVFSFTWDHVETPQANAEGITPKRDDFRTAFGIGMDL